MGEWSDQLGEHVTVHSVSVDERKRRATGLLDIEGRMIYREPRRVGFRAPDHEYTVVIDEPKLKKKEEKKDEEDE